MTMHFDECGWSPNKIVRSINAVRSSTQVVHVETDAGNAFLKGVGNPAGDEALAFELVGSRLAKLSGLFVPDFAVVENDFLEIERHDGGIVGHGPAFLSRALWGSTGGGDQSSLKNLLNHYDIALLVAFDTWVANTDRFPPSDYYHQSPNWDNIFFTPVGKKFQLTVFDHTHCFAEDLLVHALADETYLHDTRVFGAFPEFAGYLDEDSLRRAASDICLIDDDSIDRVVHSTPDEWGVVGAQKVEWARQIKERRLLLEDILLEGLIPQGIFKL